MAKLEKNYWKWDENYWTFWRKSTAICRKIQDNQDLTNNFHQARKK